MSSFSFSFFIGKSVPFYSYHFVVDYAFIALYAYTYKISCTTWVLLWKYMYVCVTILIWREVWRCYYAICSYYFVEFSYKFWLEWYNDVERFREGQERSKCAGKYSCVGLDIQKYTQSIYGNIHKMSLHFMFEYWANSSLLCPMEYYYHCWMNSCQKVAMIFVWLKQQ